MSVEHQRRHYAAKGTRRCEADIIGHDQQDIGGRLWCRSHGEKPKVLLNMPARVTLGQLGWSSARSGITALPPCGKWVCATFLVTAGLEVKGDLR